MKKVLLFLLLFMPVIIYADTCDYSKYNEQSTLAANIKYETELNRSTNSYKVTLLNVYGNIYAVHNSIIYTANAKNEIVFDNVLPGETLDVKIYTPLSECGSLLRSINISTQYYNWLYNDSRCEKYRDELTLCKYEYLSYNPTYSMLDNAIKNYENSYVSEEKVVEVQESTFLEDMKEFMMNWGIPLILMIVSSGVAITIFKVRFRKLKHGI